MTGNQQAGKPQAGPRQFVTTQWSAVLRAGDPANPEAAATLEALCASYWMPLYLYVRRRGFGTEDAQDLTQSIFLHLIECQAFGKVSPEKGRFRSYLLTSLSNFLANEWDRRKAKKRGGDQTILSIDQELAEERFHNEPATSESPDQFFDRQWAMTVMDRALKRIAVEMSNKGKARQFELLRGFLANRAGQAAYNELSEQLGTTAAALAMTVRRMRQRFRDLIQEEVCETLADTADSDEEMKHLLAAMTTGAGSSS